MAGEKILVVDDEAVVRKVVEHHLVREGFRVIAAGDGGSVFELVRAHEPDLIILDILLPDLDGIEVCREIRKGNNVPIIFLTSKRDSSDIVLGLGVGGDDYIVKPFNPKELIARVKANLRRSLLQNVVCQPPGQRKVLAYPGLEIDLPSRTVSVGGSPVALTNKEFELLALLAQNPNRVFSYNQLLELVWQFKYNADYRTVMVHINRLRRKIELDPSKPRYIITVRGIGYKFHHQ
ncbi:MAG TPA: response regulator transcription factor [Firmicutes bacterium]|nr:response regulator transcription factor [Bacillota bacterium]